MVRLDEMSSIILLPIFPSAFFLLFLLLFVGQEAAGRGVSKNILVEVSLGADFFSSIYLVPIFER